MSFTVPTDFSNTKNNYDPVPADNHVGVCVGVLDLGTHQESYQGGPLKPVHKLKLQFELPNVVRSDGNTGIIAKTFNYSLHEKATFRKTLDAWLGAGWPERHRGQSWEFLLGHPALVNVEQGPSKRDPQRTVSWIAGISKLPKGMPAPKPSRVNVFLDLSHGHLPAVLSVYDAELIRASKEYKLSTFTDEAPHPEGSPAAVAAAAGKGGASDSDDDIPF